MPTGVVERRLFYVEPDPEPRPEPPDPDKHTPLAVAGASLSSIPSHETIWGDLQELDRHNAQVKWLQDFKAEWTKIIEDRPRVAEALADRHSPWSAPYWRTRTESLARSLFVASDVTTPSAEDAIANPAHKKLAATVRRGLSDWTAPRTAEPGDRERQSTAPLLNSFDADFQLRRSFHLLYDLSRTLKTANAESRDQCRSAMRFIGRIIKAQKIVRDIMLDLRKEVLGLVDHLATDATIEDEQRHRQRATFVVNLYRLFLDATAPHWAPFLPYCGWTPYRLRDGYWKDFLHSADLSAATSAAREHAKCPADFARQALKRMSLGEDATKVLTTEDLSVRWTVLDELERASRNVLDAYCRGSRDLDALPAMVDRFMEIDMVTYPLEFVGSMYELDEIKYVRISPQDAQTALSRGTAKEKVAGDELFHFSAFLRKDWRSNDILQGRLDGICQIVHALLPPTVETLRQVKRRYGELTPLFDASNREKCARGCLPDSWNQLSSAWSGLGPELDAIYPKIQYLKPDDSFSLPTGLVAAWGAFCDQLIRVGQEDAFQQSFPSILEDHYYQEMAFGAPPEDEPSESKGTINNTSEPSETMQKGAAAWITAAKVSSKDHRDAIPIEKRWGVFKDMNLGGQPISGRGSAVPPHISGEYITHAYLLLWGMVRRSLGKPPGGATLPLGQVRLLDQATVRLVLRHPLAFLNAIFFLMRRSYTTALASIATTAGLILGVAGAAYYISGPGSGWLCAGAVVALLLFMRIVSWAVPRLKRHSLVLALVPAAVLLAAGVAVVIGMFVDHRLPSWWQQIVAFFGSPNGPVGFLIGVLAATATFVVVGRSWRRRMPS